MRGLETGLLWQTGTGITEAQRHRDTETWSAQVESAPLCASVSLCLCDKVCPGLRVPLVALFLALCLFASPALAELSYRPKPKVEAELVLVSPLEVGREFRVVGRVKALVALKRVRVVLEPPAVMRLVAPAQQIRSELAAGESVELNASLKLLQAVDGAELKLAVRFREAGLVAGDEVAVGRTMFLTADERDGGEGLPGSFWRRYTAPVAGAAGGYVLEDFGRGTTGAPQSEEERALAGYGSALATLDGGHVADAARILERLVKGCPPAVRAAVTNALAAVRAESGEFEGARALWDELLRGAEAGSRIRAYLDYNLGLLAWAKGEREVARRHLQGSLSAHPGFRQARSVLDGWAFGR